MLPEFVGMTVNGSGPNAPLMEIQALSGVQFARNTRSTDFEWEMYVATDVDKKQAVVSQIRALPTVDGVRLTSLHYKG